LLAAAGIEVLAERLHLRELVDVVFLHLGGELTLVSEHEVDLVVLVVVVENAVGEFGVTASSAALLVIVLNRLGHLVVYDIPTILLVYAHAESDRGCNHLHFIDHPPLVHLIAFDLAHGTVVV
jgi:hypothetical protein